MSNVVAIFLSGSVIIVCVHLSGTFIAASDTEVACRLTVTAPTEIVGAWNRTALTRREYCAYLGIPFARPPIGEYRFKAPVPVPLTTDKNKKWTFNEYRDPCFQSDYTDTVGNEDCLYLNVFARIDRHSSIAALSSQRPVLVFIHGGSFVMGSAYSDGFRPDGFLEEDIIVVTFNYRLDVLGFFPSLPEEQHQNNLGLMDQRMALRWVQQNIATFGGDPDRVTVMGWSAGAASVNYLLYEEEASGLFQAAIAMSGSFLSSWAFNYNPFECRQRACDSFNISHCSVDGLQAADFNVTEWVAQFLDRNLVNVDFGTTQPCFVPTVTFDGVDFFPEEKMRYYEKVPNDVPLLVGFTNRETPAFGLGQRIDERWPNYKYPNQDQQIIDAIGRHFLRLRDTSQADFDRLQDFADMYHGIYRFIEVHSKRTDRPTFVYRFDYSPSGGDMKAGAMHGDDMTLLYQNVDGRNRRANRLMSKKLLTLWSNFIKYGNPTAKDQLLDWPAFNRGPRQQMAQLHRLTRIVDWKVPKVYKTWDKFYNCLYLMDCDGLRIALKVQPPKRLKP